MFSSRLHWQLEPNPVTTVAADMRARRIAIRDLTESNPTAAGFDYDDAAIARALGDARALRFEPTPWGLPSAREAVAGYYAARGIAVDVERIMLTASTSEAYAYLFKLLCDPDDEVLVPRPSYPLFEYLARLESVRVNAYELFYDHGWHIDTRDLATRITARTRAVVLVNPNNPTGSYLKLHEHESLGDICAYHSLALISDEVFSDYSFSEDGSRSAFAAADGSALTFSLSGLSKIAGLPQLKLGWMVANGPREQLAAAMPRLELIADTYLSVGTPVQVAAPALFELGSGVRDQIRARTRANLDHLQSAVRGSALTLLSVEGGWYATVQVPRVRSEEEWVLALLREHQTLVQPGYFYDFPAEAFLVISLLTPEDTFREGVARLLTLTAAWHG